MTKYRILVLPGDGIGREVVPEAVKTLKTIDESMKSISFNFEWMEVGGQHWLKTGEEAPSDLIERTKGSDAILFGAIGWPKAVHSDGSLVGIKTLLGIRKKLDLYVNLRPVKLYPGIETPLKDRKPDEIDFVVVRENTEGLYTQIGGFLTRGNTAELSIDVRVITRKGAERVIKYAFEYAAKSKGAPIDGRKRVTVVDKSNVLHSCKFFRQVFNKVAKKYPDIEKEYFYVDAWTIQALKNPRRFHVVVTTNMFGDIITDLASVLQGGLGMAPSGNIGEKHGMFEPVHGSAPDIYGKGIANPIASILSAKMMLEWLSQKKRDPKLLEAAEAIEKSVADTLTKGKNKTPDLGGRSKTHEVGDEITSNLKVNLNKKI